MNILGTFQIFISGYVTKEKLKPLGVTEVIRISIKRGNKIIQTNTYIMIFDMLTIPLKLKIGYVT